MKPTDVFGVAKPKVAKYAKAAEGCVVPDLVIGLELETENCNTMTAKDYTKIANAHNFDLATDGSLRGAAYEFISRPMRTDNCLMALDEFFKAMKFGDTNYSDRCSVHVHVNCTDMEMEQISSLALLYTVIEEIMFEYVGAARNTNIYCIPWNQCRQHLDLINKFLADPSSSLKRWNKYTALNLLPLANIGTVEFRQMHGTADMKKLSLWINLIGSLFKWAKTYELKTLINELKSLNSNSQYEAFFTRIVSGLLPYNEIYREKLEEGVILAKFSLTSMERKRNKPSAKAEIPPVELNQNHLQEMIANAQRETRERLDRQRTRRMDEVEAQDGPRIAGLAGLGAAQHFVAVDVEGMAPPAPSAWWTNPRPDEAFHVIQQGAMIQQRPRGPGRTLRGGPVAGAMAPRPGQRFVPAPAVFEWNDDELFNDVQDNEGVA